MGNQSHLEKSRLDPELSSMLTPAPLLPSACHAHSLSLNDNSAYESLSILSISLSTLHLLSPFLSHSLFPFLSVSAGLSVSLSLLSSSISLTLSIFFFPCLSPALSLPFRISWSLGLWPLSHVSSTNNIWAIDHPGHGGAGGPPRRERRGSSLGRGLQLLQFPCLGRWGQF